MSEFKNYKRSQIAEIREVAQGDIDQYVLKDCISAFGWQHVVSISQVDSENGSPKIGDMIARDPKNHNDQWLIAEQYFKDNFEPSNVNTMTEEQIEARAMVNGFLTLGFEENISNWNYAKKCATFSIDRTIDFLNTMRGFVDTEKLDSDITYCKTVKSEIQNI